MQRVAIQKLATCIAYRYLSRLQNIPFQVVVQYKKVPKCGLGYLAYKSVPHDPLELEAAQQCFQDLIQKLHTAITVLHKFHWEHLDIILSMIILNTNPRTGKKGEGAGNEAIITVRIP